MTATIDLTHTRGDTHPISIVVSNPDGTRTDLTNKAVILTVNEEEDPVDESTQLFKVVGTVADPVSGEVVFNLSDSQANHAGLFYYDIEVSDSSSVITRVDFESYSVGQQLDISGDEIFLLSDYGDGVTMTCQERDGVKVMHMDAVNTFLCALLPSGEKSPFDFVYDAVGVADVFLRGYFSNVEVLTGLSNRSYQRFFHHKINGTEEDFRNYSATNVSPAGNDTVTTPITSDPGWWNARFRINFTTLEQFVRVWDGDFSDEPDTWTSQLQATVLSAYHIPWYPIPSFNVLDVPTGIYDLQYFGIEVTR